MKTNKVAAMLGVSCTLLIGNLTGQASALELHTGENSGAYYNEFCPTIKSGLTEKKIPVECKTSNGSLNNLDLVLENPTHFGLAQYDIFSHRHSNKEKQHPFTPIRDDIGQECLFLVTKNKLMKSYGDIVASAPYMNFILPPENSGHAGTFKYLQKIDPEGLGKANNVSHAPNTQDAITSALAQEDNVTLFVQFPDPENEFFQLVNKNGGHFVPVISQEIMAQATNGRKVYSAQETDVANPKWLSSGKKLITACTPIVLFTGNPQRVTDDALKADHNKAISALQTTPVDKLRPTKGWFSKLWTSTKAVSAKSVEGLVSATEKAKKASSPYLTKAKEKTKEAMEAAKPTYEKAKEKTKEAIEAAKPTYEKAKEKTKEAIEAAKPTYEKAKEATKSAYEKAKELGGKAMEKTKDMMENSPETAKEPVPETVPSQ